MKKILLVGGNFDNAGGRPSGLFEKICNEVKVREYEGKILADVYNGGFVDELRNNILPQVKDFDIVVWAPNVPNTEEKIRNVKEINPKTILISTKRNNNEYNFAELISRALAQKSNLVIEFSKFLENPSIYKMMVFDPLGNKFFDGTSVENMVNVLLKRALELTDFTRIGSKQSDKSTIPSVPNEKKFFEFARSCSDIFHNLINPAEGTTRFLGNMSFRCQNGFPSFRGKDNIIYVSKRNVDKRFIDANSFVATYMGENGEVRYFGDAKPSVDTPVQQRLYQMFPNMNYMIHAHCYFNGTGLKELKSDGNVYKTKIPVPCGAIEEVKEIVNAIHIFDINDARFIAINLTGHGCLLMASDVREFTELMKYKDNCFAKRPVTEDFTKEYFEKGKEDISKENCR